MPEAHDARTHLTPGPLRRTATLAAGVLGATLAPWVWACPAAASPSPLPVPPSPAATAAVSASASPTPDACKTIRYGALAAADVLQVTSVNPGAVGLSADALANLGVGQARATLATKPVRSSAAAGSLDTRAAATVSQVAPPTTAGGTNTTAGATDLGAVRLGADHLQAAAHWHDGFRCGAYLGEASGSSAALAEATVLPGAGGRSLLRVTDNLASGTTAGLLRHNGHAASAAGASLSVTRLRLFEGTGDEFTVRVLTSPSLNVIASGERATSSVRYAPPVVEIANSAGVVRRLASQGAYLDLPVPDALFGSLPRGSAAVLRLSLGTVTSRITGTEVHASAVTLRVQVALAADHATVLPRTGATSVLDLSIGALDVTADAAKAATTTSGGGYGSGSGSDPSPTPSSTIGGTTSVTPSSSLGSGSGSDSPGPGGSGAGSGTLPVTGPNLGWFLTAAGLLAGTGYALMLLARRRQAG